MDKKELRSECCGAPIKIRGIPDFVGGKEIVTVNYECTACNKGCQVVAPEKKEKGRVKKMDFVMVVRLKVSADDAAVKNLRWWKRQAGEIEKYIERAVKNRKNITVLTVAPE